MNDARCDQLNKRLTLNLLIQGAAQHVMLTGHYLVRDELDAIDGRLIPLYDRFTTLGFTQYWHGLFSILFNRPERFWKRTHLSGHPFHHHPLLAKHGRLLANATYDRVMQRARDKGIRSSHVIDEVRICGPTFRIVHIEQKHTAILEYLAVHAAHTIWGIEEDRLEASLTEHVHFGRIPKPTNFREKVLKLGIAGYSGVMRRGDRFNVVAKAWLWPVLLHELVKGVAELVCLHGLNTLDEETYESVTTTADRLELEPWLLQSGAELWRRLLLLLPDHSSLAQMLMRIARLPPHALESLMLAVIEDEAWARELLDAL